MAWECVRCRKKIFAPREHATKFAVTWSFAKGTKTLNVDIKNLRKVKPRATVTHIHCSEPDVPGFEERIRRALGLPKAYSHPLIEEPAVLDTNVA